MKIREIIEYINTFASEKWQYSWDNSGLQVGDMNSDVTGVLLCVDVLADVIDEAIEKGCNLIISHHPLLFSGVKRITDDYKSDIIRKLIKNDISVYSSHTSFDVSEYSMNRYIASELGLTSLRYLDNISEMKCTFSVVAAKNCTFEGFADVFEGVNAENITIVNTQDGRMIINGTCFKSLSGKLTQKLHRINPENTVTVSECISADSHIGLGLIGDLPGKMPAEDVIHSVRNICASGVIKASRNYKGKK